MRHYQLNQPCVFSIDCKDAMGWIEENFTKYQQNHFIALIVGAATSSKERGGSVLKLVENVKSLYRNHSPAIEG
jgi:hypothetical protein